MSDRALKEVLDALARLEKGQAALEKGQAALEKGQAELRMEMQKGFARVDERFDDLDEELALHAKVHRKIEGDITALKGRPARPVARPARRPRAR